MLTRRWRRRLISGLLVVLTCFSAIACTGGSERIRVGSKDFAEQFILGEMYAIALEENGFTVERKLNLGGTPVAQESLKADSIDLYPEYTGTGLLTVLKLPPSSDPQEVYQTVAREYRQQFDLIWLEPAPMNNSQAIVMTPETSEKLGIETISDFVATANEIILIGPPELQEREDGLPGLRKAYGDFELKEYKGVDPGLRYQSLVDGEANAAFGFTTDGEISALNLVVLADDRDFFPPYQVAPVVRQAALEKFPEIESVLNNLAPLITNETMQRLNYEVTGNQREPEDVAREFLVEAGVVQGDS